ncbi:uncharacterized protein BDZ83DRAFT_669428, partial [Colletotrichum acutatum]
MKRMKRMMMRRLGIWEARRSKGLECLLPALPSSFLSIRALSVSHMKVLASPAPSRSLPFPGRPRPFPVVPSKTSSNPIEMEMEMEVA